ncbi:MAG: hypothetical protein QXV21_02820 [Candidatus Bathyarchaeia archaeon]
MTIWEIYIAIILLASTVSFQQFTTSDFSIKPHIEALIAPFEPSEIVEVQPPNVTLWEPPPGMELPPCRYIEPIYIVAFVDEEFRSTHPNWKHDIRLWVGRASYKLGNKPLYPDYYGLIYFDISLTILQFVEWRSDGKDPYSLLCELIVEGTPHLFSYHNIRLVVIGFTGDYEAMTIYLGGKRRLVIGVCVAPFILIRDFLYCFDDNSLMHEISHIYGAPDHISSDDPGYWEDCLMSYRLEWVDFYYEDGGIWYVGMELPHALLTENYCDDCHIKVFRSAVKPNYPNTHNRWRYIK